VDYGLRKEGDMKRIAVIPGDGVGPEVIKEEIKVLKVVSKKCRIDLKFKYFNLGAEYYLKKGEVLPDKIKKELSSFEVILLGAVGDPRVKSGILEEGLLLNLRFSFDQYINLRPVKLLDESLCPLKGKKKEDVNFVVVRENTEGPYVGMGGFFKFGTPDEVALQEDVNTYKGVERVIEYAFSLAKKRGYKRVTMSDKSNVLTYGHDLWQRVFWEKARKHREISANHLFIDALCMQMIKIPEQFEVIVTSNMFGDIITDLGAQIQGGMGLAASGNINPKGVSMFEPVHGSAPKYKDKGIANPLAAILAGQMMLEHLGYQRGAKMIEDAVERSIKEGKTTKDLGGSLTTKEVGDYVCEVIGDIP